MENPPGKKGNFSVAVEGVVVGHRLVLQDNMWKNVGLVLSPPW
jgi:hypothetical protein